MRLIGHLPSEADALRFHDALTASGIASDADPDDNGSFALWVHDEDQIGPAKLLLAHYLANPASPEFTDASQRARAVRKTMEAAEKARRSTEADSARIEHERSNTHTSFVTILLIVLSVALAIYSDAGENSRALAPFSISNYVSVGEGVSIHRPTPRTADGKIPDSALVRNLGSFPEIRTGQIWRLVTPIFIHFGWLHLIFNMMLLRDLGTFLESRFGSRYLLLLTLVLAAGSNTAQYLWTKAEFGGMSGVDYGLFGFLWMRGKFDRFVSWQLNRNTVLMLMGWFILCALGIIGQVANACHTAGLLIGMAWGFLSARR